MSKARLVLSILALSLVMGWPFGVLGQGGTKETLRDQLGRPVPVPTPPLRVVSLAPSITESLFALGLDREVVGVTLYSNYPPKARDRRKVGTYTHLDLESILALRPNLVVAIKDGNPRDQVLRLAQLGLPVYVLDPRDMAGLFEAIGSLGRLLHREQEADLLLRRLKGRLNAVIRAVRGRPRPKVLLQVGFSPLVAAGGGTIQDQLIRLAGGVNVAHKCAVPYPTLSMERVLEAAPEVILISSMAHPRDASRQLNRWMKWRAIPAVAARRVYVIDGDLIDRPSPRVVDGLERLACLIHPNLLLDPSP